MATSAQPPRRRWPRRCIYPRRRVRGPLSYSHGADLTPSQEQVCLRSRLGAEGGLLKRRSSGWRQVGSLPSPRLLSPRPIPTLGAGGPADGAQEPPLGRWEASTVLTHRPVPSTTGQPRPCARGSRAS
jgi:hypothetical protein